MILFGNRHLSLSTNAIERINPLPGLKNLKILSLGRNNLKKIEKLEDVTGTLEELWLSYNKIEKLDGLQGFNKLRVIFLSNNKIKGFDELAKMVRFLLVLLRNIISLYRTATCTARASCIRRAPAGGKPLL